MSKQTKKKQWNKKKLTWNEMSPGRKAAVLVVGTVQFLLAAAAWKNLASRSSEQVNGPKGLWTVIIAVNWVGPLAYFTWGRRDDYPGAHHSP